MLKAGLLVCLVVAAAAGCAPRELPITPLDEVCTTGSYGTQIRTAGFLQGPGNTMICDGQACEMALSNVRIGGRTTLRIEVRLGTGRNAMVEPPDTFRTSDLVVVDNEGNNRVPGDWVVIQGRILNEQACLISPVNWVLVGEPPTGSTPSAADGNKDPLTAPTPAGQTAPVPTDPPPRDVPAAQPQSAAPPTAPAGTAVLSGKPGGADKPKEPTPAARKP